MSITDELREIATKTECANGRCEKLYRGDLEHIADRIDAELAERYVELPKDADGEYIHIGDVMDSRVDYLFDGKPFTVRALVLCEDGWEVADGRFGNRYEPDSLRHHHAPTVEDVLREFALAVCKDDALTIRKDVVDEYAAKLQLREDA